MLVPKVHKEENIQDHLNFPLTRDSEFQILKNSVGKRRKQIHFHITHLEEFQFSSIFRSLRVNPIYIHIADSSKELRPFWKLRDKLFWCHLMSQQQVRSSTTCQTIAQGLWDDIVHGEVWMWPLLLHNRCQMQRCFSTEQ